MFQRLKDPWSQCPKDQDISKPHSNTNIEHDSKEGPSGLLVLEIFVTPKNTWSKIPKNGFNPKFLGHPVEVDTITLGLKSKIFI